MSVFFEEDHLLFMLLSLGISVLSAYTMFQLIGNMRTTSASVYREQFWLLGGAVVFGIGTTVVHFMVMLASGIIVAVDWPLSWLLVLTAGMSYVSFLLLGSRHPLLLRMLAGSLLIAIAGSGLFYLHVLSGTFEQFELQGGVLLFSFVIVWGGAFWSFYWYKLGIGNYAFISSLVLGVSTLAMHMIGMNAVTVEYAQVMTADLLKEHVMLFAALLGIGTLLIIGFSLTTWLTNRKLAQVGEQYRLLVENSIDMIAILSDERWHYVNQSGLRMFEAEDKDQLIGKSIYVFLHPKHHKELRKRHALMEHEHSHGPIELDWYSAKGKPLHTEVVETMTVLGGKPVFQIIIRNISERKKNEELLINSEKLYVAGQLAAGIAHEIRNPLTSLKGFLQLIASGRTSSKNYYDIMKTELNRIESIVSELLMLSKPQIYELAYRDANAIVEDTVTLMEGQAILNNIEMIGSYASERLWIHGVESQIKQVFINILKNAIEVMSDGGTIYIRCMRLDEEVIVQIEDQGPGITDDQLAKIGQPFYTTKDRGTGLGLMVSYKIVDNHRGRIRAYSKLGVGTVFEIVLPYAAPSEAEADKAREGDI